MSFAMFLLECLIRRENLYPFPSFPINNDYFDKEVLIEKQIDFFYPNACQSCGRLGHLFRCSKCQMVSYCGKQHQTEHWKLHKYLCTFLADIRKKNSFLRNAKGRKQETWTNAKVACMNIISRKLGRVLTPYEEKVIQFTRACAICHDIDQQNLINCPNCASVSICHNHKNRFHEIHAEKCAGFKLCYTLDLEKFETKTESDSKLKDDSTDSNEEECQECDNYLNSNIKISIIEPAPMTLIPYFDKRLDSTSSFMEVLKFRPYENTMRLKDFEIPDLFLKPLSVFRSLELLDQLEKSEIVIHLIGAQVEDMDTYDYWEALLHIIPELKSLKIVIVHPQIATQNLNSKLCEKCIDNEKKFAFELHSLQYHEFIKKECFSVPNLAIGFLIQLKTEMESLKAVANLKIPLALTSNLQKTAQENHKYMEKLFGKSVSYSFFEENPFCGLKPILDYRSEGYYHENQFLMIFTNFEGIAIKRKNNKNSK